MLLRYAAFTDNPASGNPAGVVLDASALDPTEMLRIAAEAGYSETAFLTPVPAAPRRYVTRYYSPLAEVPFCGHATIATAVALAERIGPGRLTLETIVGEIPVQTRARDGGGYEATLTSAPASSRPAAPASVDEALAALDWQPAELDPRFPAHVANGGNDHLVLCAASRERLARLDYDYDRLGALMALEGWTTVHLVWSEAADRYHARDPFPPGGVVEDPATGAAAAAFGGYLRTIGAVRPPARLTIRQGEDMGRPSELAVDVPSGSGGIDVSGTAVPIP
jgi:PhzF family phenazine biosynthesis protein